VGHRDDLDAVARRKKPIPTRNQTPVFQRVKVYDIKLFLIRFPFPMIRQIISTLNIAPFTHSGGVKV
jgi:hypothetical protein